MINKILERYDEDQFIRMAGMDEEIIGVDPGSMCLIYSVAKIHEILMREMEYHEAVEHFDYNIASAFIGAGAPILCEDDFH